MDSRWKQIAFWVACVLTSEAAGADLNVISVSPVPRTLTSARDASISITFDKPVKPESIAALQSFWAFGRWSGNAVGTFSFANSNQTVTLNPNRDFFAGEQVMVFLSDSIEAVDGDNRSVTLDNTDAVKGDRRR